MKTIILISKCNISEIVRYYTLIQCNLADDQICSEADSDTDHCQPSAKLTCVLSAAAPHGYDPYHNRHDTNRDHNQLKWIKVVIDQLNCVHRYL